MPITGPKFGDSAPKPPSVPKKPEKGKSEPQAYPNRNLIIAACGAVGLFVVIAAASNVDTQTTSTPSSAPSAPSNESSSANLWGAIVVDHQSANYGWAYSASSEQEAVDEALNACKGLEGALNCQKLLAFRSGHAALARAADGSWGGAGGHSTEDEAKNGAISGCKQYSKQPDTCVIEKTFSF